MGWLFLVLLLACFVLDGCSSRTSTNTVNNYEREGIVFGIIGSYSSTSYQSKLDFIESLPVDIPQSLIDSARIPIKNAKKVANVVKSENVEFIVTTGDNNYEYGSQGTIDINVGSLYSEFIVNYKGEYGRGAEKKLFYPSLGNHDKLVREAYLLKSGGDLVLGKFEVNGDEIFRFTKEDYVWQIRSSNLINSEYAELIMDDLIAKNQFTTHNVTFEDGETGVGYALKLNDPPSYEVLSETNKTYLTNLFDDEDEARRITNFIFKNDLNIYDTLNIDGRDPNWELPYFDYFSLSAQNERYYKFKKMDAQTGDSVEFFILNVEATFNSDSGHEPDGNTYGSTQYNWFIREAQASTADFKIAIFSRDAHSSFDPSTELKSWEFENYVDLTFSGDVQAYERILIEEDGEKAYFISAGMGGLAIESDDPDEVDGSLKIVKDHGACFVSIKNGKLVGVMKDKDGVVKDRFEIERSDDGVKTYR